MRLMTSLFHVALAFFGYLGVHYAFAYTLPLPTAGYTILANVTAVAASSAVLLGQKRSPLRAAGVQAIRLKPSLAAVGAGVGFCLLVRLAMLTIPFPDAWREHYAERVDAVTQSPAWLRYASSMLAAPIAEEWVFRGLIYRRLKGATPRVVAVLLSSALFASLHGTVVWMLYTLLLGVLLCVLMDKTHSLWACIACHAAFNVMGQIPLWGTLPDAVVIGVFVIGAVLFAGALGWLLFGKKNTF